LGYIGLYGCRIGRRTDIRQAVRYVWSQKIFRFWSFSIYYRIGFVRDSEFHNGTGTIPRYSRYRRRSDHSNRFYNYVRRSSIRIAWQIWWYLWFYIRPFEHIWTTARSLHYRLY